ncbi:MAG: hypothetical protein EZS28_014529 [Streblomastix strix]|uniref:Tyr recombinase domain-containing protein n=1 Tax=Streblomastix strix TaxID=222440 RepID=A0A5J4W5B8_9EUKA|nr:MAG: hypothetical protein EZS28_014529 [Streblomastix strix]
MAYLGDEQATVSKQINCRTAISILFKLQRFTNENINGSAFHQIMKKPQTAMRKDRKEEPLQELDILLRHLQEKNRINTSLSEQELLGCTVTSIMEFSTLRFKDIYRAIIIKQETGACTIQISKFKEEAYEQMSKSVLIVMNAVYRNKRETVTSIRKAAITKGIDQGATQQEIDRFSMHTDGSTIVQGHNDMNLNDKIRERLSNFQ